MTVAVNSIVQDKYKFIFMKGAQKMNNLQIIVKFCRNTQSASWISIPFNNKILRGDENE